MISLETYRARIGAFAGGRRRRKDTGIRPSQGYFCIGLLLILLMIGGIEQNPGPPKFEINPNALAAYLAERFMTIKAVDRKGLSPFIEAATFFFKDSDTKKCGRILYHRWHRNTGNVKDIFNELVTNATSEREPRIPSMKNKTYLHITLDKLIGAICKVTNSNYPSTALRIFEKPRWLNICTELSCKDSSKVRGRVWRLWKKYVSSNKSLAAAESTIDYGNDKPIDRECDTDSISGPDTIDPFVFNIDSLFDNDDEDIDYRLRIAKSVVATEDESKEKLKVGKNELDQTFKESEMIMNPDLNDLTDATLSVSDLTEIARMQNVVPLPEPIVDVKPTSTNVNSDDLVSLGERVFLTSDEVSLSSDNVNEPDFTDNFINKRNSDMKHYNYEGTVEISNDDWVNIETSPNVYNWTLFQHVVKERSKCLVNACQLKLTSHRANSSSYRLRTKIRPAVVYYARCVHESCRTFNIRVFRIGLKIKMKVFSRGSVHHGTTPKTTQLKGYERSVVQEELAKTRPKTYRMEKIEETDASTILAGSLSVIRSLNVFQKAKSEKAQRADKHKDDFTDLYLQMVDDQTLNKEDRFYQEVSYPMKVCLFSICQLKMICSLLKKGAQIVLHIDSTGGVVRPMDNVYKTVYYYSGVVNLDGKIVSMFDFISVQHDVSTISSVFMKFIAFQRNFTTRTLFSHIVIDFSQALLQSIILAWNKMTVLAYLKRMYTLCNKPSYTIKSTVTVHICCNHFMSMISRDLTKLAIEKETKKYIMQAMAVLIDCSNYTDFLAKFVSVLTIFQSPILSSSVVEAIKGLGDLDTISSDLIDDEYPEKSVAEIKLPIYKQSPFFGKGQELFKVVLEKLSTDENTCEKKNIFHCTTFVKLLLNRYMPYAPLWSGFVIKHSKKDVVRSRLSNANVESWFKEVKKTVLENKTNEKIGRFVRLLVRYLKITFKQIELRVPDQACNKPRKISMERNKRKRKADHTESNTDVDFMDEDDPNVQEVWMRKKNKNKTYFQKTFFDVLPKVVKETIDSTNTQTTTSVLPTIQTAIGHPGFEVNLEEDDYNSVKDKGWVTATAMDAIIADVVLKTDKQNEVLCAYSHSGRWLLNGHNDDELLTPDLYITMESVLSCTHFLIPYNHSNCHWCLVYANMKAKQVYCFDPSPEGNFDSCSIVNGLMHLFTKLNEFAEKAGRVTDETRTIDIQDWQDCTKTVKYPKQQDGFNCGIYIIYYLEQILKFELSPFTTIEKVGISSYRRQCMSRLPQIRKATKLQKTSSSENSPQSRHQPTQQPIDDRSSQDDPPRHQVTFPIEETQEPSANVSTAHHPQLLDNGLIPDPEYYCTPLPKTFTRDLIVCYRKQSNQMGRMECQLPQTDYKKILDETWFSNCLVDYCNSTFVKPNQFCLSVNNSNQFLSESKLTITSTLVTKDLSNLALILMPFNSGSHYTLFVLDMVSKKACNLDPFTDDRQANEARWVKVKLAFKKRNSIRKDNIINLDDFSLIQVNYPLQSDAVNCGAYVVYYVSAISTENRITDMTEIDPALFRRELLIRCLKSSNDMRNVCLLCGGREKKRCDWCQCRLCLRWMHYPCLQTDVPFSDLKSLSYELLCFLCEHWVSLK